MLLLPSWVENFGELELLDLSYCESLIFLPESVGNLHNLTSLILSGCSNIRSLPASIGNLSKLTSLTLSGCSNLESIPSIGTLSQLTSLNLSGCFSLRLLPENISNLHELTTLDLNGCYNLESLPDNIEELKLTSLKLGGCSHISNILNIFSLNHLHVLIWPNGRKWEGADIREITSLELSRCSNLRLLQGSIWNFSKLTSLNLSGCSNLSSISENIGNLHELTSLDLSGCFHLESLSESIGNLTNLTSLNLGGCYKLKLPESIGNLTELTSLDLSGNYNLESLPVRIGNLSKLTSLILTGYSNPIALPSSLGNLTHLTSTLPISQSFSIPSDMDWSQFPTYVTLPLYFDYMMRANNLPSIHRQFFNYLTQFDPEYSLFSGYQISTVYGLIKRRREGGADLIQHFCSMLTNGGVTGSGYLNRILEWTNEQKKVEGLQYLKVLLMSVNGLEMKRFLSFSSGTLKCTGRRMREVWKDEGKEDLEGRREWERRWREAASIIAEEDVMETSIMHLCIPHHKNDYGLLFPSECTYKGLEIFLRKNFDKSDKHSFYHFSGMSVSFLHPPILLYSFSILKAISSMSL